MAGPAHRRQWRASHRARGAARFVLLLLLASGQTATLQLVAWSGMLVSRVGDEGLGGAISSTFSGERPCALCCAIREDDGEDRAPGPQPQRKAASDAGKDKAPLWTASWPTLPALSQRLPVRPARQSPLSGLTPTPEPPPPRSLV